MSDDVMIRMNQIYKKFNQLEVLKGIDLFSRTTKRQEVTLNKQKLRVKD